MNRMQGKFVWFEHVSGDQVGAQKFYGALFGWGAMAMPMGNDTYTMVQNGETPIAGYRTAEAGMPSHWIGYMSVDDVDASVARAVAAGAKVYMPPTDFAPMGRGAALADPQGAAFCLWRSNEGDAADVERTPVGAFGWIELMTTDAPAATKFYTSVFGYDAETMAMPGFDYTLLKAGGQPRAGIMKCEQPGVPPNWLPYIAVADCDASAARVPGLGGTVVVAPTDIPEVGRFAVITDPQGAALGVIRFNG